MVDCLQYLVGRRCTSTCDGFDEKHLFNALFFFNIIARKIIIDAVSVCHGSSDDVFNRVNESNAGMELGGATIKKSTS